MVHIGLVVTDMQLTDVVIRNYVLEFIVDADNECSHELAQVGEPAFRFEANGAYDPAYVKNQKRRLEKPLSFGDMIEWDDRDITNRIILKIRRVPKLFESRIYEGRSQVSIHLLLS
ncbi:unnamed protein product [Cylicostephanus goldi]|uniref:p-granule-associated protein DEPS-1 first OB-fold domain-containing protein n=1 Tax=Cylicostephanus goldi TaxID=71465 RepID=A0A3P6TBR0_CYLGO|nr:unnamed protein product [Cylicostephanus goldi]